MPLQAMLLRPDSRERRRDRGHSREEGDERDGREDEVISTIFVVGFPDDMGVSLPVGSADDRNANSKTYLPFHQDSKLRHLNSPLDPHDVNPTLLSSLNSPSLPRIKTSCQTNMGISRLPHLKMP
jgi:hypothetical protein